MNAKPGGPRKEISFPIESVTFTKDELDTVMEMITDNLRGSFAPFGRTAHFKLDLDIQVVRKSNKKTPPNKVNPNTGQGAPS